MEDVAGIAGSRRAEPYAFMYAILPSRTTAMEALGAPVRARTSRAALSMAACIATGRVACAGARVPPIATASRATQMWKMRRRATAGIGSPCEYGSRQMGVARVAWCGAETYRLGPRRHTPTSARIVLLAADRSSRLARVAELHERDANFLEHCRIVYRRGHLIRLAIGDRAHGPT